MRITPILGKQFKILSVASIFGLCVLVSTKTANAQQLSAKVREHVMKATGQILLGAKKPRENKIEGIGWGSGWFINSTGLMITNSHVVNVGHYAIDPWTAFQKHNQIGIAQYEITLNGGTDEEKRYRGERMYLVESADLAFLQVYDEDNSPLSTPHYLTLLPSDEVKVGQRVFAVGYPHGDKMATSREKNAPVTITSGNITDIIYAPSGRIKKFRSDAEIVGGNSGGPLVDDAGLLVGVNVEGGVDVNEAGVSAGQIPAAVVIDFLRGALGLNKIDTDLAPFLPYLLDRNQHVFVPGKARQKGIDIIEFNDGEETEGQITDEYLTWKTKFGDVRIPVNRTGYVINDDGKVYVLTDGGERLKAEAEGVEFNFTNSRGQKSRIKMANLRSVLFRRQTEQIELPDLDVVVLDGEGCKLYLTGVQGQVKFKSDEDGEISLALNEIRKVESRHSKQILHKIDGSSTTGTFLNHTFSGKLALLGSPVQLSLKNVRWVARRQAVLAELYDKSVSLTMRLQVDDDDLVTIADRLDDGDWEKAGAQLDELIEPAALKAREKPLQQQIQVLHAEYLLRNGDYESASVMFKKLRRAKIEGVASYANGRYHVLKVYPAGTYRGQQLSDPEVFDRSARDLSDQILAAANELIVANSKATVAKFSDWTKREANARKMEKDLDIATSLVLIKAERVKFQMWRYRQDLNWETLKMLFEDSSSLEAERKGRQGQGQATRNVVRKLIRVQKQVNKVLNRYRELRRMMNPLGDGPSYRVDDPSAADFLT